MNPLKSVFLTAISVVLISGTSLSNTPDPDETELQDQELMTKGNKLLKEQKFGAAVDIWQQVVTADPENANANFKLGLCLLNSADRQEEALEYLQKAVTNMTSEYHFEDAEMDAAPYDALYFLGKAFLAHQEPDSALAKFNEYSDLYYGEPPLLAHDQTLMCYNAKANVKAPRNVTITNLGDGVNSDLMESNPVVTMDNSIIFFGSRRLREDGSNSELIDDVTGLYSMDIYYAVRNAQGDWGKAQLFDHYSDWDDQPLYLSPDGLTLYFKRKEDGHENIWFTNYEDGVWNEPAKMNAKVNSPYNENGFSISGDGEYLYFSSDREGGLGKTDIYRCKKKKNGSWSAAVNLGDVINTPYSEVSPFIHPNGNTLFFSTNGNSTKGSGGYDVFYSELNSDGTWSEPQSMGYPINSTRDEYNYYITTGGTRYFNRIESGKSHELFAIEGGGFDVETLEVGTEVVTLTEEMDVTEVLEVVEEVETEVEVVETVETEVLVETEVEVVDLEALTEFETDTTDLLGTETDLTENLETDPVEEIDPLDTLDLDNLDEETRQKYIDKVKEYLAKEIENENSTLFKTIRFNFNSSSLNLFTEIEQEILLEFISENSGANIELVGYADNLGDWNTNLTLSAQRAQQVQKFLVDHKVSPNRIIYYGKGSADPVATNDTEEGRSQNRRVEVVLRAN